MPVVGNYELLEKVGRGGMSLVWRARHVHPRYRDREIAVKILKPGTTDPGVRERFRQEALLMSMLSHPNIVGIYEAQITEDSAFIAMEYVDGWTLRDIIDASPVGFVGHGLSAHVTAEVLDGLQHIHDLRDSTLRGVPVVHRDIKPSNVMLSRDGGVKILDFGIADGFERTADQYEDAVVGTRGYIAPEAFREPRLDPRADVFAAGVLLYELSTGKNPFVADDTGRFLKNNRRATFGWDAGTPKDFKDVIRRALDRKPTKRYQTASDMLGALRGLPIVPEVAVGKRSVASIVSSFHNVDDDTPSLGLDDLEGILDASIASPTAIVAGPSPFSPNAILRRRIAVVSFDSGLAPSMQEAAKGWELELVGITPGELEARCTQQSFHAVVVDHRSELSAGTVSDLWARLPAQSRPLMLVLYQGAPPMPESDYVEVCERQSSPTVWVSSLSRMLDQRGRRSFPRSEVNLNGELVTGGSRVDVTICTLSRGGAAVATGSVPRVGTTCFLRVPNTAGRSVSVPAQVSWVAPDDGDMSKVRVGLDFELTQSVHEEELIALVIDATRPKPVALPVEPSAPGTTKRRRWRKF